MVEHIQDRKEKKNKMTVSTKRIKEILENKSEMTHNEQVEICVEVLQKRRDEEDLDLAYAKANIRV